MRSGLARARRAMLGGDDAVILTGTVDHGIRIIVEGGDGKDELIDSSKVLGYFLTITPFSDAETKTEFYDSGKKTKFIEGEGTYTNDEEYILPEDPQQRYEPLIEDRFRDYNVLVPFEYNTDDGFILGIGGRINYYDFRKNYHLFIVLILQDLTLLYPSVLSSSFSATSMI